MSSRDHNLLSTLKEMQPPNKHKAMLIPVGCLGVKAKDVCYAVQEEGDTVNTPVVKITQHLNKDLGDYDLYLNYTPTELCIGMAWRAQIRRIVYSTDNSYIGIYTPSESVIGTKKAEKFSIIKLDGDINPIQPGDALKDKTIDLSVPENLRCPKVLKLKDASLKVQRQKVDAILMLLTYALVGRAWNKNADKSSRKKEGPRAFGNNIGSILVNSTNEIIGWGLNMKEVNATFHGETLMLQQYFKDKKDKEARLPQGSRLYTTLEPCFMCSGFIVTAAPEVELGKENIVVISGQNDPNISGPGKGQSALHRRVNGCTLMDWEPNTGYKLKAFLEQMQATAVESGNQKTIIDFLFGEGAEATYVEMLSVLPAVVLYKMKQSNKEALSSLETEIFRSSSDSSEIIDVQTIKSDAAKIYDYLIAYLEYGQEFLGALGKRKVLNEMSVKEADLTKPILNHIPIL